MVGDTPRMHFVLAVTVAQKRHMQEVGLIVGGVGAAVLVVAGVLGLMSMSRVVERSTVVIAGVLLTVGFIVQLLAIHGGGK
jgi:hypothetical protein